MAAGLLADPNNTTALAGLARSAKLSGNASLAGTYLDRLRAINPNDPNIASVENMGSQQNQSAQLAQAAKLAQAGQYAQAMAIYRQVFGSTPPPGIGLLPTTRPNLRRMMDGRMRLPVCGAGGEVSQ